MVPASITVPPQAYILDLPPELLDEVFSYIIPHNRTITLREKKASRQEEQRRHDAKRCLIRRGTRSRPNLDVSVRKKSDITRLTVMVSCKQLKNSAGQFFWGGNTFRFLTLLAL